MYIINQGLDILLRPTGSLTYAATNVYRNVYSALSNAVSFPTTTNCSVTNIVISGSGVTDKADAAASTSLADLNNSSNCEQQPILITGSVLFDSLTSISGGLGIFTKRDIAVNSSVVHPLKSNLTTATYSKTSFLVYSGSIGSTNLNTEEYFNTETFRIVSGNYVSQSNATSSANAWNSQTHMNAANAHGDGMVTANGFALSPLKIGNAGDTRGTIDSGILQAPEGNPNYSTLTNATRSYYRYFRNETGVSSATPTITLRGDANLISKSGAFYTGVLGENKNIFVELKVPFDPNLPVR